MSVVYKDAGQDTSEDDDEDGSQQKQREGKHDIKEDGRCYLYLLFFDVFDEYRRQVLHLLHAAMLDQVQFVVIAAVQRPYELGRIETIGLNQGDAIDSKKRIIIGFVGT